MANNGYDGYKCFNPGLNCICGDLRMIPGNTYTYYGDIKYGKAGFHFALRLEDTLRYFGGVKYEKDICRIKALGNVCWDFDNYNEYDDIGCTDKIYIVSLMSREEIIQYADELIDVKFVRFVRDYRLNSDELEYFKSKYRKNEFVFDHIRYYQDGEKDVFVRKYRPINRK